jgi:signal transduction histidine kinase
MPWVGLLLINIRPKIKRISIAAFCYAILVTLIRNYSANLQMIFAMQTILLTLIIMFIWQISIFKSIMATFLGTLLLASGEVIFLPIVLNLLGLTIETIINNTILTIFMPLPQIMVTLTIIFLCLKSDFHLLDFKEINIQSMAASEGRRKRTIVGLVLIILIVIFVQLTFCQSVYNQEYLMFKTLPLTTVGIISSIMLIMGMIAMTFLMLQLVDLTKKESQYQMQSVYMETFDELYTAIRCERHDIVNHIQTIYGFIQLGLIDEVKSYISELLGGNILTNDFIITGTPGLTALFYIKSGMARTHEIQFSVNVDKKFDDLQVPPYELNAIIGNLLNNAFDAVMSLEKNKRIINVYIGADSNRYVFKVSNYGYINDDTKQKIFKKGYSTKKGEHSGLGLYICNNLIRKYGGYMEMNNNNETHMVELSVFIPIIQAKGELYEFSGTENSSFTG